MLEFADPIVASESYVKHKTTRTIGIHITDIYNLNSAEGTFSAEFRAWSYGLKDESFVEVLGDIKNSGLPRTPSKVDSSSPTRVFSTKYSTPARTSATHS